MIKTKYSCLCKLGFHKYEFMKKIVGYVDTGNLILKCEETWIGCVNCNKIKIPKKSKWIEFREKE